MNNNLIKVLFIAGLAISSATQAKASPWWWPGNAPVKTVQLAVPVNNGGVISVTVPSKATSVKRGNEHLTPAILARRAKDSTANRLEDERIAADLERHF